MCWQNCELPGPEVTVTIFGQPFHLRIWYHWDQILCESWSWMYHSWELTLHRCTCPPAPETAGHRTVMSAIPKSYIIRWAKGTDPRDCGIGNVSLQRRKQWPTELLSPWPGNSHSCAEWVCQPLHSGWAADSLPRIPADPWPQAGDSTRGPSGGTSNSSETLSSWDLMGDLREMRFIVR